MARFQMLLIGVLVIVCNAPLGSAQSVNQGFAWFEPKTRGTTYYVSPQGNDNHSGLTTNMAFQSLQHAADTAGPGDTVLAMNGTYTEPGAASTVLFIETSGTPTAWIRFMAYPGHNPRIKINDHWGGITVAGASYILIDGFIVHGNVFNVSREYALQEMSNLNNPITSANGISVTNGDLAPSQLPHHIIIRNNHVLQCPGAGIAAKHADYVRIEDNLVHHTSFTTPYATSGISLYLNSNFDQRRAVKMFIRGNLCYRNENFVPHYYSNESDPSQRTITDGNGIVVDDTRNVQSDISNEPYTGFTLVMDNTVHSNGGRGVLVYLSDNVLVFLNDSHMNARSRTMTGDMEVNSCSNVYAMWNLILPRLNRKAIEAFDNINTVILDN